ncbi:MAG: DUF4157 domain-containing protein [Myxococcota bacterium]
MNTFKRASAQSRDRESLPMNEPQVLPSGVQRSQQLLGNAAIQHRLRDQMGSAESVSEDPVSFDGRMTSFLDSTAPIQQKRQGRQKTDAIHQAAQAGIAGASGALPFMETIQHAFGDHDVSGIDSHIGGAAEQANQSMGSKAYATGDAIAFKGSPDLHTAAHEAAHVVQQRGGVSVNDGVGAAGDVHEQHADAVADRVVQGKSAEDLLDRYAVPEAQSASTRQGRPIQHEMEEDSGPGPQSEDPDIQEEDKLWATHAKDALHPLKSMISTVSSTLNANYSAALTSYQGIQKYMDAFETKYNAALERFSNGVGAAAAQAGDQNKVLNIMFNTALGAASPLAAAALKVCTDVLGKIEKASTAISAAKGPGAPAPGGGGGDPTAPGQGGPVPWSSFANQIINSGLNMVKSNSQLTQMNNIVDAHLDFLFNVVAGEVRNARESAKAAEIDALVASVGPAIAAVSACSGASLSTTAAANSVQISTKLGVVSSRKIEQDIAIRWMASQKGKKLDNIDQAESYLENLGVFTEGENRLGYDPGAIFHDSDEAILQARAEIESDAMALIGTTADWYGGRRTGQAGHHTGTVGTVRHSYRAMGHGLAPDAGGTVTINSYTIAPIPDSISDWSRPRNFKQILRGLVTLTVQPNGTVGGGGGRPSGPSASAG